MRDAGSAIIDLSYALEDEPNATVRSPWIERQLGQPWLLICSLVRRSQRIPQRSCWRYSCCASQKAAPVKRAVATVFEPASEHGQKGMDELHEQTVNLLSFQPLPKNIFDTQVAFNMVARYGEHSVPSLATVESRVLKHYKQIVGKDAPLPSLLLVQAPIFHGHALPCTSRLGQVADIERFREHWPASM